MEVKASNSGELLVAAGVSARKPPSRLQKHAPASLQLEPASSVPAPAAWNDGGSGSGAPIPLLSPLIMSPSPVWEADQAGARREGQGEAGVGREGGGRQGARGGSGERQTDEAVKVAPPVPDGGWRHPALPTPVAEPASLVRVFQSQCAL